MRGLKNLWGRSVLVCGCGRSGTSITSSLIASYRDFEYSFDPPVVHWILSLSKGLDADLAKLLEIYLYREVFRGALSSRYLNSNRLDLSSALRFKSKSEIDWRTKAPLDQSLSDEKENRHRLCVKVTDAAFKLPFIKHFLPGIAIVGVVRNPLDTVSSILDKCWFSDTGDEMSVYETIPFRLEPSGLKIPLWLSDDDLDLWIGATEEERAVIYYLRSNFSLLAHLKSAVIINYDWFVENAYKCSNLLQDFLKVRQGDYTDQILQSVRPARDKKDAHDLILANVRESLQDELLKARAKIATIEINLPQQR